MNLIAIPNRQNLDSRDFALIEALHQGIPLVPAPYAALGKRINMAETEVIDRLRSLLEWGIIKRLGVVVNHHELGYRANAMVVWDIPDEEVDGFADRMLAFPFITLCYRRPRRPPEWPYNLFCMIHGRSREAVEAQINMLITLLELKAVPHEVLFSRRRFKQCAARLIKPLRRSG